MAVDGDAGLAPRFELEVAEVGVMSEAITQFISQVEYESADSVVDVLKVSAMDPDFSVSKRKLFLPGNELSLSIGYGPKLRHIGRGVITNVRQQFPAEGMPIISVTAYTRDHFMMEVRPDPDPPANLKPKKRQKKKKEKKVVWGKAPFDDIVKAIAAGHEMEADVDPGPYPPRNLYQPLKMTDFDMVKGLANMAGFYFWVDGDMKGKWTLHWKDPRSIIKDQKKKYTFKYSQGDDSTLFNFEPQMVFSSHYTKIQAISKTETGRTLRVSMVEDNEALMPYIPENELAEADKEIGAAQTITLFIGEYSFKAYAKNEFRDRASLEIWARNWFKRHRTDFILAKGQIPGLENMRARQRHFVDGVSKVHDGEWEFTRVRHVFDESSGYTCDFDARKLIPPGGTTQ